MGVLRARLLAAAAEVFSRKGIAASLKDVAQEADVGVGTAYRHFPTKDDLVAALFEQRLAENAHRQGALGEDCTARDIALLQVALVGIMDATPSEPEAYRRHLRLFLDGVRARR